MALIGWIYTLARKMGPGIAFIMEYLPMLIPAKRILETDALLVFEHPRPAYPVHILIVPRQSIAGFADLDARDGEFLGEVIGVVQRLVESLGLEACGYRLIVNGGKYQEFPQLHFHLVSEGVSQSQ